MGDPSRVLQKETLLSGLVEFYEDRELTDITLVVQGTEIACHKLVLAISSPYFRAMFTSDVAEASQDRVELHAVDPAAIQTLVDYMYKADTIEISNAGVQDLFVAASQFEMSDFRKLCADHMVAQMDTSNCVALYQFGSYHNDERLRQAGLQFIAAHFSHLSVSAEIMRLSLDDFMTVVATDELNIDKEEVVYETVVAWVDHDLEARRGQFKPLLDYVRVALLEPEYIVKLLETCELVKQDFGIRNRLTMAKLYSATHDSLSSQSIFLDFDLNLHLRLGMYRKPMFVFIGGNSRSSRSLACYDPEMKRNYFAIAPHTSFDFQYRVDYHRGVVTDRNKIFVLGGIFYEEHHIERDGSALRDLKMFDAPQNCWVEKASMTEPRCGHAAVYLEGKIYAIGGRPQLPDGQPLASMECYDIEHDLWTACESMPVALCSHAALAYNGTIIVIGGITPDGKVTKTFLVYTVATATWSTMSETMNEPRAEFGAGIVGDDLIVVGGNNGQFKVSSVEICDLSSGKWSWGPGFPEDRKAMASVVYNGCLYICGGERPAVLHQSKAGRVVESKDLWKYEPGSDSWVKEAKTVQYANIHCCLLADVNTETLNLTDFVSAV